MAAIVENYLIVSILVAILQYTSAALTSNGQNFEPINTVKPAVGAHVEPPNEIRQNFANRPVSAQKEGNVLSPLYNNHQLNAEYADNFGPESNQLLAKNNLNSNIHNSAKSAQEIEDEFVLNRLDLAHLSRIRMETKQLSLERKCTIYDEELRKMLAEQGALNSRALLSQVIRVLSQRKLPFGNSQPALSDLRMCLENSPSSNKAENSTGSGSVKREVIAGPNTNRNSEVRKVSSDENLRDVIDEFKEVKNNVKDFGQDIYLPKNKNLPVQKVVNTNQKVEAYDNHLMRPTENEFVEQKQPIQDRTYDSHNDYDNNRLSQTNKLRKVDSNYNAQPSDNELHMDPSFVHKKKVEPEVKDSNEVLNRIDIDRLIQVALYSKELIPEKKCEILSDELRKMTGLTSSQQELLTLVASLMSKSISPEALPVLTAINVCLKSSLSNEMKDTKQFTNQELSEPNPYDKHDRQPVYYKEPSSKHNRVADVVVEDGYDDDDDDDLPYMRVYNGNPNLVEHNYQHDEDEVQSVENEVEKQYNENFIQPNDDLFEGHNVFGQHNSHEKDVNLVTSTQDLLVEKELEIRDLRSQVARLQDLVEQAQKDSLRSKEKLSADIFRTNDDNTSQRELTLSRQLDELKAKLILQDEVIKRNFERLDEEDEYNGKGSKGKEKKKDKDKDSKKEIKDIVESAIELKGKINDDENLYDRCYRYYLLFNYPKKINKYVIKTVANLDINLANKEMLQELTEPSASDSLLKIAGLLTQTSKKKAIEVGNELYSCFETRKYGQSFERPVMNNQFSNKGNSFFDTYYNEKSSREGSRRVSIPIHRVHRAIPPIPPMPPMMSVSRHINRFR